MDINKVLGALQTIQQIRNPQPMPSFIGMDTATARRDIDLSDFYETEKVPEGFQVEGGKLVDTSAPIGIPRVIAGIGDAVSGLIGFRTDFDKRKKTGDAYHNMAWNPETNFNLAAYNSALNNANMMNPMLGSSAVPSPLSQAAAIAYGNNNFSNLQNLNQMAYNQALNQSLNTYDQYMPRNIGYATLGRNIAELMPSAQSNLKSAAQNRMNTAATSEANLRNSMANLALAAAAMAAPGGERKFG